MPVIHSPVTPLADEPLAAPGVRAGLTCSERSPLSVGCLETSVFSNFTRDILCRATWMLCVIAVPVMTGCGSDDHEARGLASQTDAPSPVASQRVASQPVAANSSITTRAESIIREAYLASIATPAETGTIDAAATTLVAAQVDEDADKNADENADEDANSEDDDSGTGNAEESAATTGKFDEEFDPAEIDTSEDEAVEPSASDWRNAELVPTPLPRKEIVAEEVPTPLGIPENARVVRKPPITPRTRADVTAVTPPAGAPLMASPGEDLPTANDASARIAASPVESTRSNTDTLMTEGNAATDSPDTVQHGTRILDQAVAAAETAALPVTGLGGPVDFQKWPAPDVALFVTGQQHGYIEPCGCTGLENQKGGVARRMTFATQLRQQGWELMPIDAGNLIRRFGRQAEIKFHRSLEALRKMGYVAVGFGPDDVRIGVGDLIQEAAAETPEDAVYASANVVLLDPSLMPAYRVVERATMKVAVTSILDPESLESTLNEEVILNDPLESAQTVMTQIKAESPDYTVLTFYGTEEAARKLVTEVEGIDLVVVAGGYGEPTYQPEAIEGSQTKMVLTGNKGMYVGLVGLYKDAEMRYARVPLDDTFGDAPEMRQLMAEYQFQLRDLGLENLGLKPIPHPSGEKFVGSETCGECHTTAYDIWENSPHFDATESLVHPGERGDVPRHFDPECISCHVTGWNPQNYYPYLSGYLNLEADSHLHGNGCENCHGPGESHAAAENGEIDVTDEQRAQLRAAMQLP
ncbi:MAG: multiheme c-type cytochrome, partial [Rhodopirellula sp. JB053]